MWYCVIASYSSSKLEALNQMKIIFNADESAALTNEERNRFITLIRKQGLNEIELSTEQEQDVSTENDDGFYTSVDHLLLKNLTELQCDALKL